METDNKTVRLRIALGAGAELDLEGDVDLLATYDGEIRALLAKLARKTPTPHESKSAGDDAVSGAPSSALVTTPDGVEDFGELLHRLPRTATSVDQMLFAGWFAQRGNGGQPFETKDASRLLLEQGIKLANPSQSMTNNLKRKHVFKVGSGYRISRDGQEHLNELLGK